MYVGTVLAAFAGVYSFEYNWCVFTVKTTPQFVKWLAGLKDRMTQRRLARRLEKAQEGNLGDVKPVGEGVMEMRAPAGACTTWSATGPSS